MKIIDTTEYVDELRKLTEEGHSVTIPVSGGSMLPFLAPDRDMICFEKPKRPIRRGDMVFYQRENGQYVMHRVRRIKDGIFDAIGDAQNITEKQISVSQIFACVTKVRRKGTWIDRKSMIWIFFSSVWIFMIPIRRPLINAYGFLTRLKTVHSRK